MGSQGPPRIPIVSVSPETARHRAPWRKLQPWTQNSCYNAVTTRVSYDHIKQNEPDSIPNSVVKLL